MIEMTEKDEQVRLTLYIPSRYVSRLRKIAERQNQIHSDVKYSVSSCARAAIREFLANHE